MVEAVLQGLRSWLTSAASSGLGIVVHDEHEVQRFWPALKGQGCQHPAQRDALDVFVYGSPEGAGYLFCAGGDSALSGL